MALPRDPALDATLAFLREGFLFVGNRCRALGSDAFVTRMMMTRVVCMRGEEAARFFYGGGRFTRKGALPQITLRLLQDKGSVDWLDGAAHRQRKAMFLNLLAADAPERIADLLEDEWRRALPTWQARGEIRLDEAAAQLLCRAACTWAGVPLGEDEVAQRASELREMFDSAGSPGPKGVRALLLRQRSERWARGLIDRARAGKVGADTPLAVIAAHRDEKGRLLSRKIAGVELLNLLRPTVAVARFITFSAHALHKLPQWRGRLASGDRATAEMFVQEVRRLYPFFPVIAGRALQRLEWKGHRFAPGDWVMLDLYGTNHDPRLWVEPESFWPERFMRWGGAGFALVPQGAGDPRNDHRCPGEAATVALMMRAVRLLTGAMTYDVPEQDLSIDLGRMPAVPKSRFVMSNIVPATSTAAADATAA